MKGFRLFRATRGDTYEELSIYGDFTCLCYYGSSVRCGMHEHQLAERHGNARGDRDDNGNSHACSDDHSSGSTLTTLGSAMDLRRSTGTSIR